LAAAEDLNGRGTDRRELSVVDDEGEQLKIDEVAGAVVVPLAIERVGAGVDLLCNLVAHAQAVDGTAWSEADRVVLVHGDLIVFVARPSFGLAKAWFRGRAG
jgi:hypothetical protein